MLVTDDDGIDRSDLGGVIAGTDLEVNYTIDRDDLVLWLHKAGCLFCRVRVRDALHRFSADQLMAFSTFNPDLMFRLCDTGEGLDRMQRLAGVTWWERIRLWRKMRAVKRRLKAGANPWTGAARYKGGK